MDERKQSIIAGQCILKVESILERCSLERVMITREEEGERKEYVVMDELKKSIRLLNQLAIHQEEKK